jgi:hypothetical protein
VILISLPHSLHTVLTSPGLFLQEERRKFEQETYVNVDNLKKRGGFTSQGDRFNNEYIVVSVPFQRYLCSESVVELLIQSIPATALLPLLDQQLLYKLGFSSPWFYILGCLSNPTRPQNSQQGCSRSARKLLLFVNALIHHLSSTICACSHKLKQIGQSCKI